MLSTGNQLRAARALAGLEQSGLAIAAGVHVNTIRKLEAVGPDYLPGNAETTRKLQMALESAGVEFLNHGRPGVRLVGSAGNE